MRPLFPFYGSKWRDAKRYGAPVFGHVVEPFAGSAGYSCYWEPSRVTLIDSDPTIIGVWLYLQRASAAEIRALPEVEVGQDVFEMGLTYEAACLIGFWLNRGSSTPKRTRTAYSTRTDRAQLVWGERARERIASESYKIKDWRIKWGSHDECPAIQEATYFIDPPYVDKGRYYKHNKVDHAQIGAWCKGLQWRVIGRQLIVCEQEGADWLPFKPLAEIKSSRGTSKEVVWYG